MSRHAKCHPVGGCNNPIHSLVWIRCFGASPKLLQEGVELFRVIDFLEAANVGGPVLNLRKDGRPSMLPLQAPSGACPVQFMCMLMGL